jgi:hypothetical protein
MPKIPTLFFVALLSLTTSCKAPTNQPRTPPERPAQQDVSETVKKQEAKDQTVVKSADQIDQKAASTPQAQSIKEDTDAIRAAVAAAPAADVAALTAALSRSLDLFEEARKQDTRLIEALTKQVEALKDSELKAQVGAMRKTGFGLLAIAAAMVFAKQVSWAVILGGSGFLLLAVAQLWHRVGSHPWFYPGLSVVVVLGLGGLAWALVHAYRKEQLAKKVQREAERAKRALQHIVPVVDEAKESLGDAFKAFLPKIGTKMNEDEKSLVRELRAEAAAKEILRAP